MDKPMLNIVPCKTYTFCKITCKISQLLLRELFSAMGFQINLCQVLLRSLKRYLTLLWRRPFANQWISFYMITASVMKELNTAVTQEKNITLFGSA